MLSASPGVHEPRGGMSGRLRARIVAGSFGVFLGIVVALVCAHGAVGALLRSGTRKTARKPTTASSMRAFREFQSPTGIDRPSGITAGREGDLWFTETRSSNIGRVTPSGKFKLFALPEHSAPTGITAGPEGNLWFTEGNSIGRITPAGKVTEFPVPPTEVPSPPPGPAITGSSPYQITVGPDGNLWFTEWFADKIGRITPSGTISQFQIPTALSHPYGITAGPDGNLWFTEEHADKIGRITPSGAITEFQVPTVGGYPYGITKGPDGNIWFTEAFTSKIGRITPSGVITEFPTPTLDSHPSSGITTGREGNLWFTEEAADQIARITPSGKISEFPVPTRESQPDGITATPSGSLWFTELYANKIARLEPRLLKCVVPKLHGKTLTEAGELLAGAHCTLGTVSKPAGSSHKLVVVSQKPVPGKTLPYGAKVSLRLR